MKRLFPIICLTFTTFMTAFLLSGCTFQELLQSAFHKDASAEEETVQEFLTVQVTDSDGETITSENGEAVTVYALYETATGGEYRINSRGEYETYAPGIVVTYPAGETVVYSDGETATYSGGEAVTNVFGLQVTDEDGEPETRAAGEVVTYGEDEIVYDDWGYKVVYHGETQTYAEGESVYDTDGERVTYPVTILYDENNETVTDSDGNTRISRIEIVTDYNGEVLLEDDGEAATRVLDPLIPDKIIDSPVADGSYYIQPFDTDALYLSASLDNELVLDYVGPDIPLFEIHSDMEGYIFFVVQDTDLVMTVEQPDQSEDQLDPDALSAQVSLAQMDRIDYEQYKYWDDAPLYTVVENQKWTISSTDDGAYTISSVLYPELVLTINSSYTDAGVGFVLSENTESDTQKFRFIAELSYFTQPIDAGTYFIRSNASNWMMLSIGDNNTEDGREVYLYSSDQGEGQQFRIEYDEFGYAIIYHGESELVLTAETAESGGSVVQHPYDGSAWQKWIITENPSGGYYIRSAMNRSLVLGNSSSYSIRVSPIVLTNIGDSLTQSWSFLTEEIPDGNYYSMDGYAQNFSSNTEYLILVSSTTNKVGIYTGYYNNWTLLYSWDCVTGAPGTSTVKGEFTVYSKLPYFDGNTDSPDWYTVYYATQWYPSYYFHSIIYYLQTEDIMSDVMGVNASHGCVRLYIENAQWIYENIPIGTKVVSY